MSETIGMSFTLAATVAFVVAYLIGSVPFGLIVARLAAGIDIRQHGSRNIGATNVWRTLGAKWGILVLALDALKGALPTALLAQLLVGPEGEGQLHLEVTCGMGAIIGHMFPCWLGFRGGKGVATALGVVLVLAPAATAAALAAFAVCFALSRIVSLSSIVGACVFCGVEIWMLCPSPFSGPRWSLAVFSLVVFALIVVRHRANIARLVRGKEPRLQLKSKPAEE
jgi:acyl phosphate:glycerol-3-phosphate acyltransferase